MLEKEGEEGEEEDSERLNFFSHFSDVVVESLIFNKDNFNGFP